MNRLCLDRSAYSHFKRGHEEVVRLIRSAREVIIPTVVIGELLTGFRLGSRVEENRQQLAQFLSNPVVAVAQVDVDVAEQYADIVVALRAAGTPIPTNDVWIAATAAKFSATVLTYDRHFERIDRVAARIIAA